MPPAAPVTTQTLSLTCMKWFPVVVGSGSTAAADAAQAAIDLFVIAPHLLQRFQRSVGGRRRGLLLAPGGQLGSLSLVAGFTLGLGLDEAALLDRGRRGSAEQDAKQDGGEELHCGS